MISRRNRSDLHLSSSALFIQRRQNGIALLILPDVSAGYASIFLPASETQQPQKIAAGQQMI